MSVFQIPNNTGQTRIIGRSETAGELSETFNVNLNNPYHKIKSSNTLLKVLDETDAGNARFQALAVYHKAGSVLAPKYYAISDDAVLVCPVTQDPTDSANWSEETGIATAGFGDETDAVTFNDLLLISRSQNILSWNESVDDNDWWTTTASGTALTSGYPHTMHVHRGGQETLFVTDQNKVRYYNTTAGNSTITLGTNLVANCVASGVDAIWVGTYSESDQNAYVYEIYIGQVDDNGTAISNRAFEVDARAVLSIAVDNNIPYIVTEKGDIQAFNGAGFITVASLPFSGSSTVLNNTRIGNVDDDNNQRPVHPKGMRARNGSIYVNFNTETENTGFSQLPFAKRSPSGVWEYNSATQQIHHRYALTETAGQYGSHIMAFSGPLLIVDTPYTFLMAAGEINNNTGGLFMESDSQFGYIITQEIESETIQDAYESVYAKAKTLASGDSFELKWRNRKRENLYGTFTLANTNTINTTDTMTGVEVGDEVTTLDGSIAGKIAHITAVSQSASVTSLTLDTDIGTAGNTATIQISNFKPIGYDDKEGTYTVANKKTYTSADGEVKRWGDFGTNPWVQFKLVFFGAVELRQFMSKGNSKQEL